MGPLPEERGGNAGNAPDFLKDSSEIEDDFFQLIPDSAHEFHD